MQHTQDDSAPSTKADIKLVLEYVRNLAEEIESVKAQMLTKEDAQTMIDASIHGSEDRMLLYFEQLRGDLLDAKRDEIESIQDTQRDHGVRIERLEVGSGVV